MCLDNSSIACSIAIAAARSHRKGHGSILRRAKCIFLIAIELAYKSNVAEGHSPEYLKCLATFPGIFGDISRNVWGHSPECLRRFRGMFGDIPWNISFPPFPEFPVFRSPFLYSCFYTQPCRAYHFSCLRVFLQCVCLVSVYYLNRFYKMICNIYETMDVKFRSTNILSVFLKNIFNLSIILILREKLRENVI